MVYLNFYAIKKTIKIDYEIINIYFLNAKETTNAILIKKFSNDDKVNI